jgi:hypothetical protein
MLGPTPKSSPPPVTQLVVVFNWLDGLKRRVPD